MKKPWGLQADGDLWKLAWQAVHERGPDAQNIFKVTGHARQQHVDSGVATAEQKEGNDWADTYADKGVWHHEPAAVQLAKWMQKRHANYVKLVGRVPAMIAVVFQVERSEREIRQTTRSSTKGYDDRKRRYHASYPSTKKTVELNNCASQRRSREYISSRVSNILTKLLTCS